MTVTYTQKVSDCKGFGSFWRLLFRWRGSLYKLVWPDTLVYSFLYFICSMVYRFALDEKQRRVFEHLSLYCDYFRNLIPISFVLGFYVTLVVQRWWEQYLSIPWPDDFALLCTAYIRGRTGTGRAIRATLLRYVNLTCVLTFAKISSKVQRKFPSYKELLEAGYLTPHEKRILEEEGTCTSVSLVFLPIKWSCKVLHCARMCHYITDDLGPKMLIHELLKVRDKTGMLIRWSEISIPLVYTQVATMAVYSFFLFSVLGRQFLDPAQKYDNRTIDFFVPIFTLLQFFFYMGWLKVAESLVNPFGDDDDDFDLDLILERHLKMSYLLGGVTSHEDPMDFERSNCEKFCPGGDSGSRSDLGLGHPVDVSHARDLARLAELARRNSMGDQDRGIFNQDDLGPSDPGRSDLGRGTPEVSISGNDRDTVILSPELPHRDNFGFIWEQMDLSVPQDPAKTSQLARKPQEARTPQRARTPQQGTSPVFLHPDVADRAEHADQDQANQGRGNQDYTNQGHTSQDHTSSGHSSLGHTSQGHTSSGHTSQGHTNQGNSSQGHTSLDHSSLGHTSQDYTSQGHTSHGNSSQGHTSSGHSSLGHTSQGHTSSGYTSQGYTNQGNSSQGHTSSDHSSLGHTTKRLTSTGQGKTDSKVEGIVNPAYME
ncbi:bestrophin-1-like [Panulirus ornatus]|uniref:bestrophin-1-like n=1 Tax=Panulirus ornatus TaxID=150431 RepID=UPI003A8C03A9